MVAENVVTDRQTDGQTKYCTITLAVHACRRLTTLDVQDISYSVFSDARNCAYIRYHQELRPTMSDRSVTGPDKIYC